MRPFFADPPNLDSVPLDPWMSVSISIPVSEENFFQSQSRPQPLEQIFGHAHVYLRVFLMPSNSTDFNQILNIPPSGHMQTIHNVIKDTSPSQENQYHHQLHQEH